MNTMQIEFWQGKFGKEYTERNTLSLSEHNKYYLDNFGVKRTEMNQQFLGDISVSKIMEVGCNVGLQLRTLQAMGYNELYGIELQSYAVEKSKEMCKDINIIQGSAFDIPFKDNYFELVFTTGVLIHISPIDINRVLDEMYRVSNKYIWGFEYYAESYTEVEYRGNRDKLWKTDFAKLFLERFPDLKIIKEKKYSYANLNNFDQMYLLEKR